jgi:PAS domain S-box-containing protein
MSNGTSIPTAAELEHSAQPNTNTNTDHRHTPTQGQPAAPNGDSSASERSRHGEHRDAELARLQEQKLADLTEGTLEELQQRLRTLSRDKEELEKKRYVDTSLNQFSEVLRLKVDSTLQSWANRLLLELVPYLEGLQASIYLAEERENESGRPEKYLYLIGGYALPDDVREEIYEGEGLTGQVLITGRELYYDKPNYFQAHTDTGLTRIQARTLLVLPLIQNKETIGVLELTALEPFTDGQLEFIRRLCNSVAGNLLSLRNQVRIQELYKQAQERQEQLQSQEEEMRQNVEELEATQEEMKRVQQQLEESKRFMDSVFDNSDIVIAATDLAGTVTAWNQRAADLFGYSKEEAVGTVNIMALYVTEDLEDHAQRLSNEYDTQLSADIDLFKYLPLEWGLTFQEELRAETQNGSEVPLELTISALVDNEGNNTGLITIAQDITERKRQEQEIQQQNEELSAREEELRQNLEQLQATEQEMRQAQEQAQASEERLKEFLNSINVGVFVLDHQGKPYYANYAAVGMMGKDIQESDTVYDLVNTYSVMRAGTDDPYPQDEMPLAIALEGFATKKDDLEFVHDDGSRLRVEAVATPIFDENDQISFAIASFTDISEKVKKAELEEQYQELAEREEQLRQQHEELVSAQAASEHAQRELSLQREAIDRAVAMVTFDPEGYILEANQNFAELLGYQPADLHNQHHSILVSDSYAASQEYQQFWAQLRAGQYQGGEFERYARDGSHRWLRASYTPVLNSDGNVTKVLKVAYDITREKNAHEELRQHHEELRSSQEEMQQTIEELETTQSRLQEQSELNRLVFESAHDAIGLFHVPSQQFTDCNPATLELLGLESKAAFIGRSPADFSAAEQAGGRSLQQFLNEEIGRTMQQGQHRFEWCYLHSDGSQREAEVQLSRFTYQGEDHLQFTFRDISAQKQYEERIRQQNEALQEAQAASRRLALVAEQTDNAVIITDADGRIEWVNEGFQRITDYTLAEVQGQKPGHMLQGPDTDPAAVDAIRQQLQRHEPVAQEILNYTKGGRPYWLDLRISPIFDEAGQLERFIAIETDITERVEREQQLARQAQELEQARAVPADQQNSPGQGAAPSPASAPAIRQEQQARVNTIARKANLAYWDWDLQTDRVFFSDVWKDMLGYEPGDLTEDMATYQALVHADEWPQLQALWQALAAGRQQEGEQVLHMLQKNGRYRKIRLTAELVKDANGQPQKVVGYQAYARRPR